MKNEARIMRVQIRQMHKMYTEPYVASACRQFPSGACEKLLLASGQAPEAWEGVRVRAECCSAHKVRFSRLRPVLSRRMESQFTLRPLAVG